ncbi:hypothetical protein [Haloprofundus halobius]|uniref:hypothetical protein n=1 Tax=Haloprofundus halobius TaxID=2876194 RepID=UPI001CCDEED7|nr:hypothetical protein [Haloprofundus halobius]
MVLRRITQIISTLFAAFVFFLFAPTILSVLAEKAAESSLVQDGTFSMGPLDRLAEVTLVWVPLTTVIGVIGIAVLATVIRVAIAQRGY